MDGWTARAKQDYFDAEAARTDGAARLSDPANAWAVEVFDLYLDAKDFLRGLTPKDLTPAQQAAFRAIRQGSGGRLGNAPVL